MRARSSPARIHTFRSTSARATRLTPSARSPTMSATKRTTLVTFDVDGTLIHTVGANANKFHKDAFAHGFREVYGVETTIDVVSHQGSTDMLISAAVMRHHGMSEEAIAERMQAHCAAMSRYALERKADAADGLELLPVVKTLLQKLSSRDDVVVCLVTGNLQPIAWAKMERLGVSDFFTPPRFGGFGSDHTDRGELVKLAAERAKEYLDFDVENGSRFHFGDTPMDIEAAERAGAVAVGLLTGIFSREQLVQSSKLDDPVIFDDLTDTESVMRTLGLA